MRVFAFLVKCLVNSFASSLDAAVSLVSSWYLSYALLHVWFDLNVIQIDSEEPTVMCKTERALSNSHPCSAELVTTTCWNHLNDCRDYMRGAAIISDMSGSDFCRVV